MTVTTPSFEDPATRARVKEMVRRILASELDYSVDEITDETDVRSDLGADSLTIVELLAELTDELGVPIDVRVLRRLVSRTPSTRFETFVNQVLYVLSDIGEIEIDAADEAQQTADADAADVEDER